MNVFLLVQSHTDRLALTRYQNEKALLIIHSKLWFTRLRRKTNCLRVVMKLLLRRINRDKTV